MSTRLRIEVRLSVLVHVGPDVGESVPSRLPDAGQSDVRLVKMLPHESGVPHLSFQIRDVLTDASIIVGSRLRDELTRKGL